MVFEMARTSPKLRLWVAVLIKTVFPKAIISRLVVMREIQTMLNERGAGVSVVANTVPADPRVE
jgi:hypothetical protein